MGGGEVCTNRGLVWLPQHHTGWEGKAWYGCHIPYGFKNMVKRVLYVGNGFRGKNGVLESIWGYVAQSALKF